VAFPSDNQAPGYLELSSDRIVEFRFCHCGIKKFLSTREQNFSRWQQGGRVVLAGERTGRRETSAHWIKELGARYIVVAVDRIRSLAASGNQDAAIVQQSRGMNYTGVSKTAGQSKTRS